MIKSISNIGNVLSKTEQRVINGGQIDCPEGTHLYCNYFACGCIADRCLDFNCEKNYDDIDKVNY